MRIEKKDESFICQNCKTLVKKLGYTSRDHCPACLHSLHVDIIPGDRASQCGGLLVPQGLKMSGKKTQIIFKCSRCGEVKHNITAADDNSELLIKLSANCP